MKDPFSSNILWHERHTKRLEEKERGREREQRKLDILVILLNLIFLDRMCIMIREMTLPLEKRREREYEQNTICSYSHVTCKHVCFTSYILASTRDINRRRRDFCVEERSTYRKKTNQYQKSMVSLGTEERTFHIDSFFDFEFLDVYIYVYAYTINAMNHLIIIKNVQIFR